MLRTLFRAAPLFLLACGSQAAVCDEMAYWSVTLTVVDADGEAVPGAAATYSVDGEDRGECELIEGSAFACGVEEAGDFVVTVTVEGYEPAEQAVTVTQGTCHVVGRELTFVVAPAAEG